MTKVISSIGIGLALTVISGPLALAQSGDNAGNPNDVITVTATRTPNPIEQVASSVTVITRKQLLATDQPFVADALRSVPGVYLLQTGGVGGLAQLYTRGGEPGDTLVMIDGVPVNDPASTDTSYDFSNLMVANIDRIEILRGSQSTLYGSDATAGVVNIITRKGGGKNRNEVSLEAGRYRTLSGSLSSLGTIGTWDYSATATRFTTDGFPLADLQSGDTHNDGYRNTSLSARTEDHVSDQFSVSLIGNYIKGSDNYPGFPVDQAVDDGNHVADSEQTTLRVQGNLTPLNSRWSGTFGASSNTLNRDYLDQVAGQPDSQSNFNGRTYKLDWQANYEANDANLLTFGAEHQRDQSQFTSPYDSSDSRHIITSSIYGQDQITLAPKWFATVGARNDKHETFGNKTTYRVTTSYTIPHTETRVKATYGTGFKAPSLFQLYDATYGNVLLQPEQSKTYDVGVEQSIAGHRGAISATYFHNNYDNLIEFTTVGNVSNYQNVSTAQAHGVEFVANYSPSIKLHLALNYTYTKTEGADGKPLPRRPGNLYSFDASYAATQKLDFNLTALYIGDRLDPAPYPLVATLPNYALFNLASNYKFARNCTLNVRVDNVFDKKYEEAYSYATPRRGVYFGVTAGF